MNESTCPVHQQDNTGILDITFHLAQLVCSELKPDLRAFAFKLYKHHVDSKGGLPDAIGKHEKHEKLTKLLTPSSITRLVRMRAEYMLQLFLKALSARTQYGTIGLADRIIKHRAVFYEVDYICHLAEPETISAVYASSLQGLIKNGSFKTADVTEVAHDCKIKSDSSGVAAAPSAVSTDGVTDGDEVGTTLTSQPTLSAFGINTAYNADGDCSTMLKSSDALFVLKATLAANVTGICRTVECC